MANDGNQRQATANEGKRRQTKANDDKQRQTKANDSKGRQAVASKDSKITTTANYKRQSTVGNGNSHGNSNSDIGNNLA